MTNLLYDALLAPHLGNDAAFVQADDGDCVSYDAFVKRAAQDGPMCWWGRGSGPGIG